MRNYFLKTTILFLICFTTYSQEDVVKDTITRQELVEWLIDQQKRINDNRKGIPGFRVQIYSDSGIRSRLRTEQEKADFDEKYPDVGSYLIYEEPYFKLRVGNFRTRLDARRFLESISRQYEYAFIVTDIIEFPDLE